MNIFQFLWAAHIQHQNPCFGFPADHMDKHFYIIFRFYFHWGESSFSTRRHRHRDTELMVRKKNLLLNGVKPSSVLILFIWPVQISQCDCMISLQDRERKRLISDLFSWVSGVGELANAAAAAVDWRLVKALRHKADGLRLTTAETNNVWPIL